MRSTHSERLLPGIERLVSCAGWSMKDFDLLAVTEGPGSFTGLRVGIATAKGLAHALSLPICSLSSLEVLASSLIYSKFPVAALLDARKEEVYGGLYDCSGSIPKNIYADGAYSPESFLSSIKGDTVFIGEGAIRYKDEIEAICGKQANFISGFQNQIIVSAALPLIRQKISEGSLVSYSDFLPVYHRLSEAEVNAAKKTP